MSDDAPASGPGAGVPPPAFSADELARIAGGTLLQTTSRSIRGAAVDSRLVRTGELFVAVPGERTDGHRFLADAAAAGASALLVTHAPDDFAALGDVAVVLVPDALAALHRIATAWRTRFSPLVVGVTGSIAKTSTKEAVATVLAERFTTLRSEGNQNNEIGLPLTVLRLGPEHEAAVLEMGMYVGGEIRGLARIGRPRIGVVTAVQPVHLSRIGSIEAVERAKAELVEELPSAADGGVAVLNADDARVRRMGNRTTARVVSYGFDDTADARAVDIRSEGFGGMAFTVILPGGQPVAARTPTLGQMAVHNALAAAAVGSIAGLDPGAIVRGLARGWSAPHRAELIHLDGVTIVDDSYNASPASVSAALALLAGLPGRRIAVLGEMLELGDETDAGHRAVGGVAAAVVDELLVVGEGAAGIAVGAREAGLPGDSILVAPDVEAALDALRVRLRPGDVLLVKASRGVALDRLVDALRAERAPVAGRPR